MPVKHTVKVGECLSSIAVAEGFFPNSIWDDEANAALRELRANNPNALQAGDLLVIPDKRKREHSVAMDARHVFRRKGVPAQFRVKLLIEDEPVANQPYVLRVDGSSIFGVTDGDGVVLESISPAARRAVLTIGEGEDATEYSFSLGGLDPADTPEGARQRLFNLGYDAGDTDEELADGLRELQGAEGLAPSGELDAATVARLTALHDRV
jgi:N-acetylmuramoyl-L-alanine amidase